MKEFQTFYRDEDGGFAVHSTWVPNAETINGANITALVDALQDATNAKLYKKGLRNPETITGDAATANPYDIADKGVFTFRTVAGAVLRFVVPAPLQTIFSADDLIDTADTLVVALATAVIGKVGLPGGVAGDLVESFIGGYRDRRNRTRYT